MKILSKKRTTTPLLANQQLYTRLYQAVVLRAVQDLAHRQRRDDAREWLLSPESDHAFTTAGISPHSIRQLIV
jgi:hypothetical protein